MTFDIRIPKLPETIKDAKISVWNFDIGERVEKDQLICELETDKVILEIPASVSGILTEIKIDEGAPANSEDIVATISPIKH